MFFLDYYINRQTPVFVAKGDYSVISLAFYFLKYRLWSIRRSLRYLYHRIGDRLMDYCRSKEFFDGVMILINEEAILLPHLWPSVSYNSFLTFSLGQVNIINIISYKYNF